MFFDDEEIEYIIKLLEPKINKALLQTTKENRADLKQDILELIITKLKNNTLSDVPDFFQYLEDYEDK